jgi:peptidyl-prolyl cis-trans isomerase D
MFTFVDRNKKLIQITFLVLIVPPFALFGVDAYFRGIEGGQTVAEVGDYVVSEEEFSRALRERQQSLQRAMQGQRIDPALLDTPALRTATLETLIQRRLLIDQAHKAGIAVSDGQLKAAISSEAVFKDANGKFSFSNYEQYLHSENMTPAMFEARLRQDMMLRQVTDGYAGSGFVPRTVSGLLARLAGEQREVSHATLSPDGFLARVKLDAEAAKQYYDANTGEFRVPEQARVEYVVLSADALMERLQPDPAEVKKFYDANRSQFGAEEARQAAHILVAVEAGASPEMKQKARAKAEAIHRDLAKKPAGFAEIAKKQSNDPGSAAKGGDLGYVSRGSMQDIPEFERALFQLKPGEISAPVETQHGFHILRLLAVRESRVKAFEEVRGQIEMEMRKQLAARRFAELADGFSNVVYEQSESLKPAAELSGTALLQSGWITRASAEAPLGNARLLAAIFSDETLKDRRNTEAIEVEPGILVAARLLESKPASIRPFEEVRAELERKLASREAARLAAEEGRRLLDELRQGKPVQVAWSAPQTVSRDEPPKDLPEPVLQQAFRMDAAKVPAYSGVDSLQGTYVLLRVSKVQEAGNIPPEKAKALSDRMRMMQGQEAITAYIASLRQRAGVKINQERVVKRDDPTPPAAPVPSDRPSAPRRGGL